MDVNMPIEPNRDSVPTSITVSAILTREWLGGDDSGHWETVLRSGPGTYDNLLDDMYENFQGGKYLDDYHDLRVKITIEVEGRID